MTSRERRAAQDPAESDTDSSVDEQDLEAFHGRMNDKDDQETGGGWVKKLKKILILVFKFNFF